MQQKLNTNSNRITKSQLQDLLKKQILVFDGAMGTQIQNKNLGAKDYGGEEYEGCCEILSKPEVIADIHNTYLKAGANIIETNTFGSTPLVLNEYGLGEKALEISQKAAQIAKACISNFRSKAVALVAGSMGPTTKAISVTGGITFDELITNYHIQAKGLLLGGVDLLMLETGQDTRNIKAGLIGIRNAITELNLNEDDIAIVVSGTIEPMGTMLAGQTAESLHTSLEHAGLVAIGLNCATGPDAMQDHIRALSEISPYYISCMPNAGLPDEDSNYNESPISLANKLKYFCDQNLVNFLGGCCGTTPEHIEELAKLAKSCKPRKPKENFISALSGIDFLNLAETHPQIVGERTNVIGSKLFKKLITANNFEEAGEVGRKQVRNGAHIVDICLANPDRDEKSDMIEFLNAISRTVRVPIMIDSTDQDVIEEALKRIQGKSIINSINLENGEERFAQVCPLIKKYGAAVVVGCIDEDPVQGMGLTITRKLEIATRSFELLTKKYNIPVRDIIFDPLVFPCGTGDQQYIGTAQQTIQGTKAIKRAFPLCRTTLGISNVSFGLPLKGREVLNTVFLHHNLQAGLDMPIVNSQKLERITHIPKIEIELCNALINADKNNFDKTLQDFVTHFRGKKPTKEKQDKKNITVEKRLSEAIIEGTKTDLEENLTEALQKYKPLKIINGPLMDGMSVVGELFGDNKLIVAEVLQSAEVMKTAVSFLEPLMKTDEKNTKGTMVLATVKGDVHDIGKNLVDIILSNNGFNVINLGIKILPHTLIEAVLKHKPDLIGLSGLLVRSAQEMITTAKALKQANIPTTMLVGGAALSERFTYGRIAPSYDGLVCYAKDAMSGLALANQVTSKQLVPNLKTEVLEKMQRAANEIAQKAQTKKSIITSTTEKLFISHEHQAPTPPNDKLNILKHTPLEEVWSFINPSMLYTRHLGLKGKLAHLLEIGDEKAIKLKKSVVEVEEIVLQEKLLTCHATYQFFKATAQNETLFLQNRKKTVAEFTFPRQKHKEQRCLSDLVPTLSSQKHDYVALFVTSCQGTKRPIRDIAEEWKNQGQYLKSHILLALAIETAEAEAEWLHQKLRAMWGFKDPKNITNKDLFKAKYRGCRYSFGYPACPDLENQKKLWQVLKPEENIGVTLTDGFMMDPESSVSAMVFHHPQAQYFSVL